MNAQLIDPDLVAFPDFDDNLRQSMKQETELFFESIMREDRSVMDLLNADYTFVNERLARHYGIPDVYGSRFRRVQIPDDRRRGLLGQASILTVTSYPNRTSPVERGKWILTNLLGVPPQPPPPNIPPLQENGADGRVLPLRERMEKHRASPVCAGCHRLMDPIGFSMENFDGIGRWRDQEDGLPIDASGTLFTGAKVNGVPALRREMAAHPDVFVGVLTEKMLTYALGRGIEYYDMPAVRKIVHDAKATNYRFSSIVLGIAAQRAVPDEGTGTHQHHRKDRYSMSAIFKKHLSRRTFLQGVGATIALAAARRDGAGGYAARADGGAANGSPWPVLHPARCGDDPVDAGRGRPAAAVANAVAAGRAPRPGRRAE